MNCKRVAKQIYLNFLKLFLCASYSRVSYQISSSTLQLGIAIATIVLNCSFLHFSQFFRCPLLWRV